MQRNDEPADLTHSCIDTVPNSLATNGGSKMATHMVSTLGGQQVAPVSFTAWPPGTEGTVYLPSGQKVGSIKSSYTGGEGTIYDAQGNTVGTVFGSAFDERCLAVSRDGSTVGGMKSHQVMKGTKPETWTPVATVSTDWTASDDESIRQFEITTGRGDPGIGLPAIVENIKHKQRALAGVAALLLAPVGIAEAPSATPAAPAASPQCPNCKAHNSSYVSSSSDILPTPPGANWPPMPRSWDTYSCASCGASYRIFTKGVPEGTTETISRPQRPSGTSTRRRSSSGSWYPGPVMFIVMGVFFIVAAVGFPSAISPGRYYEPYCAGLFLLLGLLSLFTAVKAYLDRKDS